MFRMIFGTTLAVFFMVVGVSLVNAQKPEQAKASKMNEHLVQRHRAEHSLFDGDGVKVQAKTDVGIDKMCLALDLQQVRLTINHAIEDPETVDSEMVADSIDLLLYHLEGTEEGDILIELLANDEATMEDYLKTVNDVEKTLQKSLKGEEIWAFNVGLEMCNVYQESNSGTAANLKNALQKLEKLVAEAPKYLTGEEVKIFREIAGFASKQTLVDEDYVAIQGGLDNFVTLYFKTAS
jgi:hypothetical protein